MTSHLSAPVSNVSFSDTFVLSEKFKVDSLLGKLEKRSEEAADILHPR